MRRAVLLILGIAALLLTPGAPGDPDVDGDPTPPVVAPVITGTLGSAGWYTTNVTVNWSITDPESIILSTSGCDARTLSADTVGTRLSCTATSDGGETTVAKTFKVDKTAPAAGATPSRGADVNGWYNHELSVDFAGSDGTSGLESCSADQSYGGPDTGGGTLSGTCRDLAGNVAPVSFAFKYDETPPQASPTARAPDANGWYNHALTVTYQGTDGTSGVGTCTETTYSGPDDPSVALAGTCVDRAGNESGASILTLKYDETAPQATATASRTADVNGWYNHAVTVSFAGDDATAGLDSCDPPATYAGPDATSASVVGSCRDRAGNVAPRSYTLKYDATAPQTTATPSRQPNANGWYRAPLTVSFAATDAVSGTSSCVPAKSYGGPDDSSAVVTGTCVDNAGNAGAAALGLKYDATAPQTTASPARQPNANGWYRTPLAVTFVGPDAMSGTDSCDATQTYSGPDTASATMSGACRDKAGNSAAASFALKYDATAPQVTAAPGRAANSNGWYNAPLSVSFTGGDATSGVDSCDAAKTYSGPDSTAAAVTGSCLDRAGNGGSTSLPLKYDATAPQATATPSRASDTNGWYNRALTVTFAATDATAGLQACDPAKGYAGPDSAAAAVSGACSDKAGNVGSAVLPLKYDATAPQVGAAASRPPNPNGWHNAALSVSFAGTDATAGIDSCDAAKTYSGPDTAAATISGSCRDKAGNSGGGSLTLMFDATKPQVTAAAERAADANGWFNAPVRVGFTGGDATSGVDRCDPPARYAGPDNAATSVTGTCRDKADNVGSGSFPLAYDATPPQTTATPSRQPNVNGWHKAPFEVSFTATDAVSGLQSCPQPQGYAGPDTSSGVVTGTCLDRAGNGAPASFALKYDATAPEATASSRPPDGHGWYRQPLTVTFSGADATSGVEACSAPRDYAGPDTANSAAQGSCRDRAGNESAEATFGFKYDATAPQVTDAVAVRPPDRPDWYNRPIAFAVAGSDATSGLDACAPVTYRGPDSPTATVTGSCVDKAGNSGTRPFTLRYDGTGPDARAAPSRAPDANDWYGDPVTVTFSGEDAVSGLESCEPPAAYEGPDSALVELAGVCLDRAGNASVASFPLHFDATAPQVTTVSPDRQPDANGWYNRRLTVGFRGTDATSGIETCSQASYAGPDAGSASLSGSCRDFAGNVSDAASFALRYDGTPPSLAAVKAKAGNGTVTLSWTASPDATGVEIRRAGRLVYQGSGASFTDTRLTNGTRYSYTVIAYDEARNAVEEAVTAKPTAPLVSPPAGARVSAPPRLAWTSVPKATYYNVQLWRRGKILSVWPRGTSFRVRRSWTYAGRRHRLVPGRYRWYVWPGYGRRAERKFGPLLGSSSFVVR